MLSAEEARGYGARFDVVAGRGRALVALLSSWWTPTRRGGYDRGLGLLGALAFVTPTPQGPRLEPGRGAPGRGSRYGLRPHQNTHAPSRARGSTPEDRRAALW